MFLLFGLAVVIASSVRTRLGWPVTLTITALLCIASVKEYRSTYGKLARIAINTNNNETLGIASSLRSAIDPNEALIIYGKDWSSELPFYVDRKSLAVPSWFEQTEDVIENSHSYLGPLKLGAIVFFGSS
jgi:hypothetical protein